MHQMAHRGIKFTHQPTAEIAADSLTKGLGASGLPQIKDDLRLIEDSYVMVLLNVVAFNVIA